MNVSSIGNNSALLAKLMHNAKVTSASGSDSSQLSSIMDTLPGLIGANSDGDTFQMTGATSASGSAYNSSGSSSNSNLDLKSFLDKVANGTVTVSDLENMQSKLQSWKSDHAQSAPPPPPPIGNSGDDPIRNFLDKVSKGTATSSDLQTMQSLLQNMAANRTQGAANSDSSNDPIKSFLDKIAAGTATTTDLKAMQKVLQQLQQSSASQGHHRHHHHQDNSNADKSGSTGTAMDLKTFLGKVAQGSVTSTDLLTMQTELQKFQQQFASSQK